jgi:hypothetical protein
MRGPIYNWGCSGTREIERWIKEKYIGRIDRGFTVVSRLFSYRSELSQKGVSKYTVPDS